MQGLHSQGQYKSYICAVPVSQRERCLFSEHHRRLDESFAFDFLWREGGPICDVLKRSVRSTAGLQVSLGHLCFKLICFFLQLL